jgi:oligopeptide/dipeptide ABC transporter ATP-binding protein
MFDGIDLTAASSREMRGIRGRRIAMVFQDSMTSLNPLLTVGRQITESMEAHLGLSYREAFRRATGLLEEVGVPEPARRLKQYPFQLSGGLRQRVAIAVALSSDPEMLIADEPTTALDVTIQAQVLELLKREQEKRNMSLLLITHDLGVVARTVDRVHVLYAGRIVEEAPTGRLFAEPRHPYTLGLLRSVPGITGEVQERLPSIPGNPPPISHLPIGCPFRPRCGFSVDRCRELDPALESTGEGSAAACWVDVRKVVS